MIGDWTWSSELRIPSATCATSQAIDPLLAHLHNEAWTEHDIFGVHLAVEEALVNAIKHGNRESEAKSVRVQYRSNGNCVQIEIADEGEGFDPQSISDPTSPEHLEEPNGRGLLLMRSFMTRVEFNAVGNQVLLEKCRST